MEQSELIELSLWEGLGMQLHTSATGDHAAQPPLPSLPRADAGIKKI
jgi:hypothetical protein